MIVEAAILATASGGAALVLAYWFDELVRQLLMPELIESTGLNTRILVAATAGAACAFVVAIVVGALQIPRHVSLMDLTASRRIWRRSTAQKELLIVQTTLAVLLIAAAGLFGRSYYNLAHQDFGMDPTDVLTVGFAPGVETPNQDDLFTAAAERVRALPGVSGATVFAALPDAGVQVPPISVPGRAEPPTLDGTMPFLIKATPEFFDILRIPVVEGRAFMAADHRRAAVAIVDETMARTVWPGTSAIGKCFRVGFDPALDPSTATGPPMPPASAPCLEIVGVVRDLGGVTPGQTSPRVMRYFLPWSYDITFPRGAPPIPRASGLLVRHASADDRLAQSIRRVVVDGRTDLPFLEIHPYADLIQPRMTPWRIGTRLLLLFGALALTVAAMGIHAAFAHAVAERRHEMAVRLAVGASHAGVRVMLLRESVSVAAMGVLYGAIVAALAGRVMRWMFFGTSSTDPLVLGSAGALMLIVAVVATWLPAVAASRADPNALLRSE